MPPGYIHEIYQLMRHDLPFLDTYPDKYYFLLNNERKTRGLKTNCLPAARWGCGWLWWCASGAPLLDSAITDTGLTQSSWTVLMQLHQLGDNVSVSELAEVQGIELPPLMRTLSLLEKQGYLVRSTSPYDKRIRLLTLTAEGRAILEKLSCVIETYQERVTQTIPEADLATFSATLNQIACRLRNIREEDNKI
ncbi:putative MarR family regulatory protein [Klebsiella pneumoniae]|uniref:Putative MarR family regulatory protein n=6 Tax=Bacteria TaxID=2 RepID=A0A377TJP1_KLEPN|nr:putative MarR family regulatory protein [Klebsiella pneumoniae]